MYGKCGELIRKTSAWTRIQSQSIDSPQKVRFWQSFPFHASLKYVSTDERTYRQSPQTAFPISRESPRLRRFTRYRDTYYRKFERTYRDSKESLSIPACARARGDITRSWRILAWLMDIRTYLKDWKFNASNSVKVSLWERRVIIDFSAWLSSREVRYFKPSRR